MLAYADDRGRDAFAFEPIESPYLEVADDLRIRTPYSKTVVEELRAVPWAWWDGDLKAWRVPFRSWERRRRRYPVPDEALPPLDQVVMTHLGAILFTDITGELVEDALAKRFYPDVSAAGATLVWATWRKPTHDELVKAWPARWAADIRDLARGWWQPTIEELRIERRKAASTERALETRRAGSVQNVGGSSGQW